MFHQQQQQQQQQQNNNNQIVEDDYVFVGLGAEEENSSNVIDLLLDFASTNNSNDDDDSYNLVPSNDEENYDYCSFYDNNNVHDRVSSPYLSCATSLATDVTLTDVVVNDDAGGVGQSGDGSRSNNLLPSNNVGEEEMMMDMDIDFITIVNGDIHNDDDAGDGTTTAGPIPMEWSSSSYDDEIHHATTTTNDNNHVIDNNNNNNSNDNIGHNAVVNIRDIKNKKKNGRRLSNKKLRMKMKALKKAQNKVVPAPTTTTQQQQHQQQCESKTVPSSWAMVTSVPSTMVAPRRMDKIRTVSISE
jgi:hypothetical protein